eukprot:SAG31_NODE_603_length_13622_cov_19.019953_15_plen_100_part_00
MNVSGKPSSTANSLILCLPYPVEQQIVLDEMPMAEGVVEVYTCSWTIIYPPKNKAHSSVSDPYAKTCWQYAQATLATKRVLHDVAEKSADVCLPVTPIS